MSKERAHRRAAREREAAIRTAARAAEAERRERQLARRKTVRAATTGRLGLTGASSGRPSGLLEQRRRRQDGVLVFALAVLNVVVWVVRDDWPARLGALVVTVLAFPVIRVLLFGRR
jgi:hypothetical protein